MQHNNEMKQNSSRQDTVKYPQDKGKTEITNEQGIHMFSGKKHNIVQLPEMYNLTTFF